MATLRVLIVEDMANVRERLSNVIESQSDFELVAVTENVEQGLQALLAHKPDLALVDLGLPDGSGVEVIRAIGQQKLKTQALVISGFQDEKNVFKALEAGARGYVYKLEEDQKIIEAINYILEGGAPISPIIARLVLNKFQTPEPDENQTEALTSKQQNILLYISQGFTSKEIAEKLGISYYTVTTHIKNIYEKLQVNSRVEAIYEARKIGLID